MVDPYKITWTDKLLAATVLKLFPARVTPNQITIFRFITIPFIAYLLSSGEYRWATVLFFISAFSDALDGALARTTNRITEWGTAYDPVADKLLIGLAVFLILPHYLGPLIAFMIILMEMILIGMGYYFRNSRDKQFQANWWGKLKMLFESVGVMLVLLYSLFPVGFFLISAEVILYAAVGLAFVSLINYAKVRNI